MSDTTASGSWTDIRDVNIHPNPWGLVMHESSQAVKNGSVSTTMWGVLSIVPGVLAMGFPLLTSLSLAMLIGISMLVAGVSQTVFALQAGSFRAGIVRWLFGGITVFAGTVMVAQPGMTPASLTLLLAIYFFADGLNGIIAPVSVKAGSAKAWVAFNGVIALMLGVMIWRGWPLSDAWAIGVLLGIRLIVSGLTILALGSMRSAVMRDS